MPSRRQPAQSIMEYALLIGALIIVIVLAALLLTGRMEGIYASFMGIEVPAQGASEMGDEDPPPAAVDEAEQLGFEALNLSIEDDGVFMTIFGTPSVLAGEAPHDLAQLNVELLNPYEDLGEAVDGEVNVTLLCSDVADGDRQLSLVAVPNEGPSARAVIDLPVCGG